MIKNINKSILIQIFIYLFVNVLFILKYTQRTSIQPLIPAVLYVLFITGLCLFFKILSNKKDKLFKYLTFTVTSLTVIFITFILIKIDPLSVRVDRWSAVTYFLDSLLKGEYPYAASTHVSSTNYPSPFPVWYLVNFPFYILGDTGIGLIFFFLLVVFVFYKFSKSYKITFLFLLFLILSPAYWWEVAVRSDSLSNAILVFSIIIFYEVRKLSMDKNFLLTIIICGLVASTRLSAILPLAIYFFPSFLKINLKKKIVFSISVISLFVITFLPFILWNTQEWIFFKRNPFMSQTSVGNTFVLGIMMLFGIYLSIKWKETNQFLNNTSLYVFIFMISSLIGLIVTKGIDNSIFTDSTYDISYLNLCLPYCIAYISNNITPSLSDS